MNFINLIIYFAVTFLIFLSVYLFIKSKTNLSLVDQNYNKPQAFHKTPTPRIGGFAAIICLCVFFLLNYIFNEIILYDYAFVAISLFILGFLDDTKVWINPSTRLVFMIILLCFLINIFSLFIYKTGFAFLNNWIENYYFIAILFSLLCFVFIINGANLIDGFNGLLGIHFLIINSVLVYVNYTNNHADFSFFLMAQILIIISFIIFNFPKSRIFLGDGGSYLFGGLISMNVINTSKLNPEISPFFFCVILFYLFYEVFFSFCRKAFKKKSPVKPDSNHLHMLIFDKLQSLNIKNSNAMTGLVINLVYLLLILPIYFNFNSGHENVLFFRYWFFTLLVIYTLIYAKLYRSKKK